MSFTTTPPPTTTTAAIAARYLRTDVTELEARHLCMAGGGGRHAAAAASLPILISPNPSLQTFGDILRFVLGSSSLSS